MSGFLTSPTFNPPVGPITLGTNGQVLAMVGGVPAFVNRAGVAPQVVQSAFVRITDGSITGTVTLPSNPTPGNFLVGIGAGFDNRGGVGSEVRLPVGFGIINDYVTADQAINVGLRKVQAGDGPAWVFGGGNGGNTYGILEFQPFSNVTTVTSVPNRVQDLAGVTLTFGAAGVPAGAYAIGVVESDQTNALVSLTGATLLFDGTDVAANHPAVIFQVTTLEDDILLEYSTPLAFGEVVGMLVTIFT